MATVFSFPVTNIPTGTFQIPQTSLGASVNSVSISLARCTTAQPTIWPNAATTITLNVEFSFDGGTTWEAGFSFEAFGGKVQRAGTDVPFSQGSWTFPQIPTHVRGSIVVVSGPLRTSGTITVN